LSAVPEVRELLHHILVLDDLPGYRRVLICHGWGLVKLGDAELGTAQSPVRTFSGLAATCFMWRLPAKGAGRPCTKRDFRHYFREY
jgi:hypothetical protein